MKTTMPMRPIANPRRITLAQVQVTVDSPQAAEPRTAPAQVPAPGQSSAEERLLPRRTANPRRTVLTELPDAC